MANLEDLIVPTTPEQQDAQQLALFQASDLPVTSWTTGSTPREMARVFAEGIADASFSIAQIANGNTREYSKGAWLNRHGSSNYDEARKAADFTRGKAILQDNGGGPHNVTNGQFTISTEDGKLLYRVEAGGGVLALNGSMTVDVVAYAAGGKYNVPNGTITRLVTSAPTVTVSNPEIGTSGTWITTLGVDREEDAPYRNRLPLKWATLSTGSPPAAYLSWALGVVGVARAKLDDGNPDGPGTNRLYVDNAGTLVTLQALLNGKAPSGTRTTAYAAVTQSVALPAILYVFKGFRDAVQSAHVGILTDLATEIDIGGEVIKAEVSERLMGVAGMKDIQIGSGWPANLGDNVQLSANGLPQFTPSLQYIEV